MRTSSSLVAVDFDWTVFNLRLLTQAMASALGKYGIEAQLFQENFEQAKHNEEGFYDRESHIRAILRSVGKTEELTGAILKDWVEIVTTRSAAAFDRQEFSNFRGALSGWEVVILTYGEYAFQKSKLDASGVGEMADEVYITSETYGKEKHLREFLQRHTRVVSINDAVEPNDRFLRDFAKEVAEGRLLILEMQREYKNAAKKRSSFPSGIVPVSDLGVQTLELITNFLTAH